MPIFRVTSEKFTPAKKILHGYIRGIRDKYEVCPFPLFDRNCWHLLHIHQLSFDSHPPATPCPYLQKNGTGSTRSNNIC